MNIITRSNFALDRFTIFCLYVSGFQGQISKHVKFWSEQFKKMREKNKNKGSVRVAESTNNSQNAKFGLVIEFRSGRPSHRVFSDKLRSLFVTLSCFRPDRFVQLLSLIPILILLFYFLLRGEKKATDFNLYYNFSG